jgi:Flp pilus assembly protein TadG
MRIARRVAGQKAQSLVEFTLVLPLFLMLVFGVIDFGLGLRAYISVASSTREAARYASVGNPAGTFVSGGTGQCDGTTNTSAVGRACTALNSLDLGDIQSVSVTYPTGQAPGNPVRVQVTYRYHYITPVKSIINVLSGGNIPGYLTVTSTTDMRLE